MLYLTEILGLPVYDSSGKRIGRVAELAAIPAAHPPRVALLLLRDGKDQPPRSVPLEQVSSLSQHRVRLRVSGDEIQSFHPDEALLLLRKDLLDQQIIDVHGRKVVRVNDLALEEKSANRHTDLLLSEVDIGLSGALRRLLSGAVPRSWLRTLEAGVKRTTIRWEFVDLLEPDPLRRVKLHISHQALSKLHPADLADIMEELAPKERQSIIAALDDTTAAEALSEVDPKLQVSIVEALDTARAVHIVEEMQPDAAADLLGDLSEETTSELLQDMDREDAAELGELLEFPEKSAGGLMTTEYVALPGTSEAQVAREVLGRIPELPDNFNTIFLVDPGGKLIGAVPLARLIIAAPQEPLAELKSDPLLSAPAESPQNDVVELFDKYNLLSLPVVDEESRLVGVVTADDIISVLRKKS